MVLVGIGLSLSRFLCWNRLVSCTAWQTSSCQILSPASAQQHQQFSLFSLLASAASPACNSDCTLFYFILFFYTQSCQTSGFISVSMPCNMQVMVPAVSSVYHGWEKQPPYGAFRSFRGETKHLFRLHACANMADSFEHTCLEKTIRPKTYVPLKTVEQYCTFVYCSTQGDRQSTDKTASVGGFSNDFCYLFHCVWCKVWRCFLVAVQITASNHSLGFSQ